MSAGGKGERSSAERRMEARLEVPLLLAALLVIPSIAIEQSEAGAGLRTAALVMNWVAWSAFVGEAVLMLRVTESRGRWLREHPLEVAVILLTPPFLPASLQAARAFRLLRLLRIVRATRILRRLLSTDGVRDASVLALMTILGGGAGFASVEKAQELSTWDGVWWAIVTVTTVGYGDISPQTDAGRLIAMGVMFVGIGFVAILTAAAAERFLRGQRKEASDLRRLEDRVADLTAQIERLRNDESPPPAGG